jgi:NADH-quinone oxidoreductase subunit N
MTPADLLHSLPLIILGAGVVVTMLAIAAHRSHVLTVVLTLVTLVLSALALQVPASGTDALIGALIQFDGYAIFFMVLILLAAIAVVAITYGYMSGRSVMKEEFYVLLLIAVLGCAFLVSSRHFASLFLGLEVLSVSLYALIAYNRSDPTDIEAGIKYLVLAAVSVSFLLLGMALIYVTSGTMEFTRILNGLCSLLASS